MELLLDPSAWMGLITLIVLEIVLGIDNLVFVAIVADKLPFNQRDKARIIGLVLAMVTRLGLLSIVSWIVTLTKPLVSYGGFSLSVRDLILIIGGVFLLFKATMELHERLEGHEHQDNQGKGNAKFWVVIVQIIILDAVFSLDSVITAVGMVDELAIMMAAVIISMIVMIYASKSLTKFVIEHPTVVVLCLSFLMMIGVSLVADGVGFHIPKGYIYAAISFSLLIEFFNQVARRNFLKNQSKIPFRDRTAEKILGLLGGNAPRQAAGNTENMLQESFAEEERYMINGVLTLASRSLRSIMTPRIEVSWIDCEDSLEEIKVQIMATPHNIFPVCQGELDKIIGVVRAKDLLMVINENGNVAEFAEQYPPIIVPDMIDVINLLPTLKKAKGRLVIITNEFDTVQGIATPVDVLEAIAGEFPDEDETSKIIKDGDGWLVKGSTDIHSVMMTLNCGAFFDHDEEYVSLAGFLFAHHKRILNVGEVIEIQQLRFKVLEVKDYRIELVRITKITDVNEQ
ncbi:TerC family protein [Commensalibacter nepenthis]|uniref:TerC family protein n=1 Tax=Commensalibacter nepenthis TaxID=3043872 RepID=A0ABT6Q732_9PROT|nr:TerC family protein [Commensalibacter sp. TBRC 10068]MDI2112053.1 TerC family protein [Commensalibacter sp. TBRC 10068]